MGNKQPLIQFLNLLHIWSRSNRLLQCVTAYPYMKPVLSQGQIKARKGKVSKSGAET